MRPWPPRDHRPKPPRPTRWTAAASLLAVACAGAGCEPIDDGGHRAMTLAIQPFCPLWGDGQLQADRAGIPCPWPGTSGPGAAPCAVSHRLGDAARTTRRVALNGSGLVIATSDHDAAGKVLAARVYQYEQKGAETTQHVYRNTCGAPVATYLYSRKLTVEHAPKTLRYTGPHGSAQVTAEVVGGLLSDQLWLHGAGERRFGLAVDRDGHVIARRRAGEDIEGRGTTVRGGRLRSETIPTSHPGRHATLTYRYDKAGRLTQITTAAEGSKGAINQRFGFAYRCDATPACEPAASATPPHDPLALDPYLDDFAPRTCSEQLEHSPRICDALTAMGGDVSAICCQTSPDDILLQWVSPLLGGAAGRLQLESSDGRRIDSEPCQAMRAGDRPAWRCAIPRATIATMAAEPTPAVALSKQGQGLSRTVVDLSRLQAAAR